MWQIRIETALKDGIRTAASAEDAPAVKDKLSFSAGPVTRVNVGGALPGRLFHSVGDMASKNSSTPST